MEYMITLGCHSDNFGLLSGEETFSFISRLGFSFIDVSTRSFTSQEKIILDYKKEAANIKMLSEKYLLYPEELFLGEVEISGDKPHFLPEEEGKKNELLKNFNKICLFAKMAGFKSIMASPCNEVKELGFSSSFDKAVQRHEALIKIADENGISYHVEPTRTSLINTPEKALEMAKILPKLRYTLDFLHFQINGILQKDVMVLIPHTGHMHARQAKKGTGKCSYDEGELDFNAIMAELHKNNWQGNICMEFWNGPAENDAGINPVDQNILMRFELKKLIKKYYC